MEYLQSINHTYTLIGLAASVGLTFLLLIVLGATSKRRRTAEARVKALEQKYATILDADGEAKKLVDDAMEKAEGLVDAAEKTANKLVSDAESRVSELSSQVETITASISKLRAQYADKKVIYDRLMSEVAIFDERLAFAEMGVYEPHFDFTDSEQFKAEIEAVRAKQKAMVTNKTAATCAIKWSVDGSASKGQTMTNRAIRLTLRAFNNECDAAIANVRWNNANAMVRRLGYAREQIDKLNVSNQVTIAEEYYRLKLLELKLTHEYREKQKVEREERAEAARAAREEQRLLREIEEAEREEARYQKLVAKAKAEALGAEGAKLEAYQRQIEMLEADLAEAHAKVERAQAMAEVTTSGYVYIISNVGSFGPEVVKIGLTRRLDPTDRVRELGDASVPFVFDTHAMIYSDEAPALERALHLEFEGRRVNAANYRKEFFRVGLDEVEEAVARLAPGASFFRDIEAQEYMETVALRNTKIEADQARAESVFPEMI
ncbi:DUF4041 domain-containing protein [Thalassobaculum sp. OXR-137]|uniref:DUF4041 domain-containing protein n=1 Tax=Thalassobaculum sp. OXR-137 TaxID=3100173 RepID=UPI002AC9989B|nr:DUF4041 domain-containing protein [Thalassobaculum sp. OXR-137]WPZ34525.1 DUF4041 domain-containing protein [Thalassobaculum sp. OXR-137]